MNLPVPQIAIVERQTIIGEMLADTLKSELSVQTCHFTKPAPSVDSDLLLSCMPDGLPSEQIIKDASNVLGSTSIQRVAFLTDSLTKGATKQLLDLGAIGVIFRSSTKSTFLNAVRFMLVGEVYLPRSGYADQIEISGLELTQEERCVLEKVCYARSNSEISSQLEIAESRVKFHIKSLARKLSARNRTHLAMIARDRGLI